jgi:drug/metabolite transporter (DMT)-like permease
MTSRASAALAVASLVGAVAAWSASLSVVRIAVASVPPGGVTFWRCVVGALVLWACVALRGRRSSAVFELRPPGRAWIGWALACGASCGAAFLLIAIGMRTVGAGPAGVVLSSIPALTIVLAAGPLGAHGAHIGPRQLASVGLGVLAAVTLALSAGGAWSVLGLAVLGLAAMTHAVSNVTSARSLETKDPITVAAMAMTGAAVVSAPFALTVTQLPSLASLLAIVLLGVLPSGAAYVMYFHGTAVLGVERAAYSNFLVPPVAMASGIVALGEAPDPATLAALVLALAALAVGTVGVRTRRPVEVPLTRMRPSPVPAPVLRQPIAEPARSSRG